MKCKYSSISLLVITVQLISAVHCQREQFCNLKNYTILDVSYNPPNPYLDFKVLEMPIPPDQRRFIVQLPVFFKLVDQNPIIFQSFDPPKFPRILKNGKPDEVLQSQSVSLTFSSYIILEADNDQHTFEIQLTKQDNLKNIKMSYSELFQCRPDDIRKARLQGILYDSKLKRFVIFRAWHYYFVETDKLDKAFEYKPDQRNLFNLKEKLKSTNAKYYSAHNKIVVFPLSGNESNAFIYFDNQMSIKLLDHPTIKNLTLFQNQTWETICEFYGELVGIVYVDTIKHYVLFYGTGYRLTNGFEQNQILGEFYRYKQIDPNYAVDYVFRVDTKVYFVFSSAAYLVAELQTFQTVNDSYKLQEFELKPESQTGSNLIINTKQTEHGKRKDEFRFIVASVLFLLFLLTFTLNFIYRTHFRYRKRKEQKRVVRSKSSSIAASKTSKVSDPSYESFPDISQLKVVPNKRAIIPPTYIKLIKAKMSKQTRDTRALKSSSKMSSKSIVKIPAKAIANSNRATMPIDRSTSISSSSNKT